jgi:predicted HTH transcriptional regulator
VATHYIKKLIQEGEHQRLDFKFEISDSRKIAKTLVAFSNTDGGTLLIGVKDNGKIAGIRSEEEEYMVGAAATMYCKPKIEFHSRKWQVEGKTVLEVLIPKSNNAPHFAEVEKNKWLAFLRLKDENVLANNVHLKIWKKRKLNKAIYIEFSDKEKFLLQYLRENKSITLSKFCKIALLTRKNAENILANLISLQLIEMIYAENRFEYTLIR